MIDCLYNITMILDDPAENGPLYRRFGLKKRLLDIEEDQATYAGKPEWDNYNSEQKKALDWLIRASGFTEDEVRRAKPWKTLGTYLLQGKPEDATPHQSVLEDLYSLAVAPAFGALACQFRGVYRGDSCRRVFRN